MKRLTQLGICAAVATCLSPAFAQDTGTTGDTHGNTTAQATTMSARTAPTPPGITHTISASADPSHTGITKSMGAGRADASGADTGGAGVGWIGLLGILGLMALRRRDSPGAPRG
jgi:hypothetical protein